MFRPLIAALVLGLAAPVAAQMKVPLSQAEIQLGFVPLVKQAAPAVVNIYARRVVAGRVSPFADDPFFRDFFRDLGRTQQRVQNSLGSGVILTDDGIIVSNFHVIGDATDIRVVLTDRREFSARLLLADEESDLAILKIEEPTGPVPHLALRDSDTVEVGELVLAIGNPFGVGQTVSSGIVSGLARTGTATGSMRGYFIQTDAPINPGNSGGALVDMNGALIGINTSILTRSGGSNGIGFAIPASLVAQFLAQAQAGSDRFARPWAGMGGQAVDGDIAESLGLGVPTGVVISDLHSVSPFRMSGFQSGDVITHVDGHPVNTPAEMIYRMSVAGIGADARVGRLRNGSFAEVVVPMMAAPDAPPRKALRLSDDELLPGVELALVNPAVIAELGLSLAAEGVVITDVGPQGGRFGLQAGDILLSVNGREVHEPVDVAGLLRGANRRLDLILLRDGQRVVISFRL